MINRQDTRHNARVLALSNLFCFMFADEEELYSTLLFKEEAGTFNYDVDLYYRIYNGVKDNLEEIDEKIEANATDWPIKNIAKVDLIILRIAIYELVFENSKQTSIIIDEAVELAKEFGNDNSSKFIHGVLGAVIS